MKLMHTGMRLILSYAWVVVWYLDFIHGCRCMYRKIGVENMKLAVKRENCRIYRQKRHNASEEIFEKSVFVLPRSTH